MEWSELRPRASECRYRIGGNDPAFIELLPEGIHVGATRIATCALFDFTIPKTALQIGNRVLEVIIPLSRIAHMGPGSEQCSPSILGASLFAPYPNM